MTQQDRYGNPITTDSEAAAQAYRLGVDLFLSGNFGAAGAFAEAVKADPNFALGHVALARINQMGAKPGPAAEAMEKAQALSEACTTRERQHIAAFAHAVAGRTGDARAAVMDHVRDFPRDAFAAQMCCSVLGLIGFSGEVGREAELLSYTSWLLPHYQDDWWMLSMHALSLCEAGQTKASHDTMDRSLALNPRNANAAHFKAHAHYEAGETTAGRAFLANWMLDYDSRGALHGHLTWHAALWALEDGDMTSVWAAIDDGIAPGTTASVPINIVTDTAAIYHRAEMAGHKVAPERWAALSDYAAQAFPNPGQSFIDMHAALGHAMAGQGDRLARLAETRAGFAADLVRPVARAWGAIAREDWQTALDELTQVLGENVRFGGSRAQRDLIELSYVNTLMKLGHTDEARRALKTRRPVISRQIDVAA